MLLEVLLAGLGELDGNELEAAVLEAGDDGANEATLGGESVCFANLTTRLIAIETHAAAAMDREVVVAYLDAIRLDSNEAIPNS